MGLNPEFFKADLCFITIVNMFYTDYQYPGVYYRILFCDLLDYKFLQAASRKSVQQFLRERLSSIHVWSDVWRLTIQEEYESMKYIYV